MDEKPSSSQYRDFIQEFGQNIANAIIGDSEKFSKDMTTYINRASGKGLRNLAGDLNVFHDQVQRKSFNWVIELLFFDQPEFKNTPIGKLSNNIYLESNTRKNFLSDLRSAGMSYLSNELEADSEVLKSYLDSVKKSYLSEISSSSIQATTTTAATTTKTTTQTMSDTSSSTTDESKRDDSLVKKLKETVVGNLFIIRLKNSNEYDSFFENYMKIKNSGASFSKEEKKLIETIDQMINSKAANFFKVLMSRDIEESLAKFQKVAEKHHISGKTSLPSLYSNIKQNQVKPMIEEKLKSEGLSPELAGQKAISLINNLINNFDNIQSYAAVTTTTSTKPSQVTTTTTKESTIPQSIVSKFSFLPSVKQKEKDLPTLIESYLTSSAFSKKIRGLTEYTDFVNAVNKTVGNYTPHSSLPNLIQEISASFDNKKVSAENLFKEIMSPEYDKKVTNLVAHAINDQSMSNEHKSHFSALPEKLLALREKISAHLGKKFSKDEGEVKSAIEEIVSQGGSEGPRPTT